MKVVTLTLNPAFDMHCKTQNFQLGKESFFTVTSFDAGGKGINVSRALTACKVENRAIVVVGKENGGDFLSRLNKSNINYTPIFVEGRIRENVILRDDSQVETRVSFNGFEVDGKLLDEVYESLSDLVAGDFVSITGSNPKGISVKEVIAFVKKLQARGIKVVIDNRSFSLDDLIEAKPFLIKPNREEISKYIGEEVESVEKAKEVAEKLHGLGIENVMISLGEAGACLSSDDGVFYEASPKVKVLSTIGAGDSTIAGFIYAKSKGKSCAEALKSAVAFGAAACMTEGTNPPDFETIKNLL